MLGTVRHELAFPLENRGERPPAVARGVEEVALVPNGDLQYVSEQVAREKVARLGKAKTATMEAAA